jgi:hypothetical protein
MLVNVYVLRVYCIFDQLTNSNVLGKLPIRDSNNRVNWKWLLGGFGKNTLHT